MPFSILGKIRTKKSKQQLTYLIISFSFRGKLEGLADYLWDIHWLQLIKKDLIRTALLLDAENATFHLSSLLAFDFWKVVNRAKYDHAAEESSIADSTCMEGHLK